jgi:hypothetical protein
MRGDLRPLEDSARRPRVGTVHELDRPTECSERDTLRRTRDGVFGFVQESRPIGCPTEESFKGHYAGALAIAVANRDQNLVARQFIDFITSNGLFSIKCGAT